MKLDIDGKWKHGGILIEVGENVHGQDLVAPGSNNDLIPEYRSLLQ